MKIIYRFLYLHISQKSSLWNTLLVLLLSSGILQSCNNKNLSTQEAETQINEYLKQKGTVLILNKNNYLYSFDLLTKPYLTCIENLKSYGYIDYEITKHDSSTEIKNLKLNDRIKPYLKTYNESTYLFPITIGYYQAIIDSITDPVSYNSSLLNCYVTFKKGDFIPNELGKICNYAEAFKINESSTKAAQFVNADKGWKLKFCEN